MSINRRKYKGYKEYLKHQSKKMDIGVKKKINKFMPEYFSNNVRSFEKRIGKFKKYIKTGQVLCLGARTGAEVVAFRNLGFKDTIGIDINPGENNEYVIKGDFHNMKFKNNSFDIVYCNCIDHSWDLRKLSKEIFRVSKDDAFLLLEIDHLVKKSKKERKSLLKRDSKYESVMWDDFDDIKNELKEFKFVKDFISAHPAFLSVIFKKISK